MSEYPASMVQPAQVAEVDPRAVRVGEYMNTGYWAVWQGDQLLVVTARKESAESIRNGLAGSERSA